jgi:hypothetical protein
LTKSLASSSSFPLVSANDRQACAVSTRSVLAIKMRRRRRSKFVFYGSQKLLPLSRFATRRAMVVDTFIVKPELQGEAALPPREAGTWS